MRCLGSARRRGRLCMLVVGLLVLGLAACGGSSDPGATVVEGGVYQLEVQQPFEGYEPRGATELSAFVEAANAAVDQRTGKTSSSEEGQLMDKVAKDFASANAAYREGQYAEAVAAYLSILDTHPTHLGANVNLTLAYLQLQRDEEALEQALVCAKLFPDDPGTLLNAQVAGVACGFATEDIATALEGLCNAPVDELVGSGEMQSYWEYNDLWSRIETELHGAADTADASGDGEGQAATGEEGADADGRKAYQQLQDDFDALEDSLDDDDEAGLRAYLYEVGLQLGYEVDPDLVDPARGFPYVVADDGLCTLTLTGVELNDSTWNVVVSYQAANRCADKTLLVASGPRWQVNGTDTGIIFNGRSVAPGETAEGSISLSTSDELVSFAGIVCLQDAGGTEVARYPLAWKAPDEG